MTRRTRADFMRDVRGVSVMVGALLLMGIFVASMITIRVSYVPAWEEDREADTSRAVAREFAQIKADQDRLVTNGSALPLAHQVTLTQRSDSMFRLPTVPSTLEYVEADQLFRITAPSANILLHNGTDYTRLNETYQVIPDAHGDTVLDVGRLLTLRLRIDEVNGTLHHGSAVLVRLQDAAGDTAGSIQVRVDDSGPGFKVIVETRDRWATLLHTETTGYVEGLAIAPFYLDLHEPRHRFADVLKSADGPVDLNLTHSFPSGTAAYTLTYTQSGLGGEVLRTTGGHAETGFQKRYVGGTLKYDAHNRYFVENGWRLEHGALLRVQSDGTLLHSGPRFSVGIVRDDILRVSLVLPHGTGHGTSISGTGSTTLTMGTETSERLVAEAPEFRFNMTTGHPAAWALHWARVLDAAGLSDDAPDPQYVVRTGDNWVEVQITGFGAPGSNDVYLDLHQGTVRYTIDG